MCIECCSEQIQGSLTKAGAGAMSTKFEGAGESTVEYGEKSSAE